MAIYQVLIVKTRTLILLSVLSLYLVPEYVISEDANEALMHLQDLVNNPSAVREMKKNIKDPSTEDLAVLSELKKTLNKELETIASSLPRKVNKDITFKSAALSGDNIVYSYILSDDMAEIENKNEFMNKMKNIVKNYVCTSPSGAWLIYGYTWSFIYQREDGTYYGGIVVDAGSCGFE